MANARESNTCICQVCVVVRERLSKIFIILNTYGWLLDTYIVDFFEENVWSKLPSQWAKVLDDVYPEELGGWVLGKSSSERVWPLSLLAFRKNIEMLGINRKYSTKDTILQCSGSQKRTSINILQQSTDVSSLAKRKITDPKYKKLFTKSVKKKKCHEIENLSETAFKCASAAKCECIVDIGAGMGHLARSLAYNYDLCVVCLEQDESLSHQARKYDENLFELLRKKNPNILARHPHHIQTRVSETDLQGNDLPEKLKKEFMKQFDLDNLKDGGFGLIGLHTCGDLAATLLKFYAQQENARFICIVGCCYMKITSGEISFLECLLRFCIRDTLLLECVLQQHPCTPAYERCLERGKKITKENDHFVPHHIVRHSDFEDFHRFAGYRFYHTRSFTDRFPDYSLRFFPGGAFIDFFGWTFHAALDRSCP